MNDYLMRADAPISAETWQALDGIMVEAAKSVLSGRRLLAVEGPYGLGLKAVPLRDQEGSASITSAVLPLSLIQQAFSIAKRDLAAYERDKVAFDASGVARAAIECAKIEDSVIFQGAAGNPGLLNVKGAGSLPLGGWEQVGAAAEDIIKAITSLDGSGLHGPYALALAPARYNLLLRRYPQGTVSELEHVQAMATAGVIKAPALDEGGVLIASGRQFAAIVVGQDMSVGFIGPARERLEFSISESLALLIRLPQAVCVLGTKQGKK